jgi:hypothetical protein
MKLLSSSASASKAAKLLVLVPWQWGQAHCTHAPAPTCGACKEAQVLLGRVLAGVVLDETALAPSTWGVVPLGKPDVDVIALLRRWLCVAGGLAGRGCLHSLHGLQGACRTLLWQGTWLC